ECSNVQAFKRFNSDIRFSALALRYDRAWQRNGECAALPRRALDPDSATVGFDQLAADREAKAAALLLAALARNLTKLLKDQRQMLRLDADASVAHADGKVWRYAAAIARDHGFRRAVARLQLGRLANRALDRGFIRHDHTLGRDRNRTFFSEFDRVREQVQQNLTDLFGVG